MPEDQSGDQQATVAFSPRPDEHRQGQVIRETLLLARQMSTVRFAAVPVFFAATGAIAKFYVSEANAISAPTDERILPLVGLFTAILFLVVETVISYNLICFYTEIKDRDRDGYWSPVYAHRTNGSILWAARIALLSPYPLTAAYWIYHIVRWIWPAWATLTTAGFAAFLLFAVPCYVWTAPSRAPGQFTVNVAKTTSRDHNGSLLSRLSIFAMVGFLLANEESGSMTRLAGAGLAVAIGLVLNAVISIGANLERRNAIVRSVASR
jgi:hypothetical protein